MKQEVTPSYRPHPARHAFSRAGILLFVLLIVGLFAGTTFVARELIQNGQLGAVITATLVDLTNEDRTQDALGTLTINETLVKAAQAKADDMAEKGYFAHTTPDGKEPWDFMREAGYSFTYAGENLAVNFGDSEDVVKAWMDSPTHRANILNGKFTEIGIATAVGQYKGQKTLFVVQMFGTPRSVPASSAPVVEAPEEIEVAILPREEEESVDVLGTEVAEPLPEEVEMPSAGALGETTEETESAPVYTTQIERAVASPHEALRVLYLVCAGVIVLLLGLATRLEFKKHHAPHAVAAFSLLLLMVGLFTVADWFVFSEPIVTETLAFFSY